MKTKIKTLGAGLSLLATLLTTYAAGHGGPGGGGGGGGTEGGTIYYVGPEAYGSVMHSMNPDGTGKTTLGFSFGKPSTVLHNNHRWFVYNYAIPGEYYPDGTQRVEAVAVRDDYDYLNNNNATTAVQLTDDATLEPRADVDWIFGDALISFKARRWSSPDPGAFVVEGGIYNASLAFDAAGNIIGLTSQPATPAISFPLVETSPGDFWPDLHDYFSWDPAGDLVVYANPARSELWVADQLGTRTRIFAGQYDGQADQPQWSPTGSLIAFRGPGGICTIQPDGRRFKVIIPHTSTWVFSSPRFSPSGSNLVYTGFYQPDGNFDVFRATSSGGSPVNLTDTFFPDNEYENQTSGGGWQ